MSGPRLNAKEVLALTFGLVLPTPTAIPRSWLRLRPGCGLWRRSYAEPRGGRRSYSKGCRRPRRERWPQPARPRP